MIPDRSKFERLYIKEEKKLNFIHNKEKMLKQIINHCMKKVILLKSEYLKVCATRLKTGILYGETEVDEPVEHNFPPLCPSI